MRVTVLCAPGTRCLTQTVAREHTCFIPKTKSSVSPVAGAESGTAHQGRSAESSFFRKEFPYEKTDVDLLRACTRHVPARACSGGYQAGRDEAGHHESRKGIGKGGQPNR